MKRLTVLLAAFAFLVLGAGMAQANHKFYNPYRVHRPPHLCHVQPTFHPRSIGFGQPYYGGFHRGFQPIYSPGFHAISPFYAPPRVGIGIGTPNFSFFYAR